MVAWSRARTKLGVIFKRGALLASSWLLLTAVKAKTFSMKDKEHRTSTGTPADKDGVGE